MKVLMIGPISEHGGVSTHTREMIKALKKLGIDIQFFNIYSPLGDRTGKKDLLSIYNNIYKLFKMTLGILIVAYKKRKWYEIIHIQTSGPIFGFIPAIMVKYIKWITNKPIILTFHHSKTESFIVKYRKTFKNVIERINTLIVVSDKQKKVIIKNINLGNKHNIRVIPNGFNPAKFKKVSKGIAKEELKISKNKKVLVNVALLLKKKGHKYLIDALYLLKEEYGYNNYICYIIGKGPLKSKIQKQILDLDLNNNIKLLGYVEDEELVKYLNASDFFILPSLEEGNPIVMFESLSLGLPFIGTRVGGIPEIIGTNEDIGILTESKNSKGLSKAIIKGIKKKWDYNKIINYSQNYTWENIAKKTIDVYDMEKYNRK